MLHNSKTPLIHECCLGYLIMIRELLFFFFCWICVDLKGFNFSKTGNSVGIEVKKQKKNIPVLR